MDFFRRLFGTTDEEVIESDARSATHGNTPNTAEQQTESISDMQTDELDGSTFPIGPQADDSPSGAVTDGVTQPLNADHVIAGRETEYIAFGQATDVGLKRSNNQDSILSFYAASSSDTEDRPNFGLFVVADGMGGHTDGERASSIAIQVIATRVMKTIYLPMLTDNGTSDDQVPLSETLVDAIHKANDEVIRHVPEGGTTVTCVATVKDLAYVVHVGDSRAYLITEESIEQITRDHSLVQRLIELGQITPDEAETHPQKNVLYRALGQNENVEVDMLTRRLPMNSRILICSDGLWSQVEERELYEIAMNHADPQQACDKLVALANTRGGIDNISAILLKMS
jgi:protein phosphatase